MKKKVLIGVVAVGAVAFAVSCALVNKDFNNMNFEPKSEE